MDEPNPYQSPAELSPTDEQAAAPVEERAPEGVWRQGKLLVIRRNNPVLPDRCVKTNERVYGRRKRLRLVKCPLLVFLSLAIHVILFLILYLIFRRKATVELGLTDTWRARRQRLLLTGWAMIGVGLPVFLVSLTGFGQAAPEAENWYYFFCWMYSIETWN